MQGALRRYLAGGGALFASGAYVASDLWAEEAPDAGRAFAEEVLHCALDTGRAAERGRVRVMTAHKDFSRGEYRFNDEYRPDRYIVESPDALKPVGEGAFAVMRYVESGRTAGVACEAEGRTFVVGFPFESILSHTERDRMMRDALRFLLNENIK